MRKLKTGFTEYTAAQLMEIAGKAGPAIANNPKFSGITPAPSLLATQTADVRKKMLATGLGASSALRASMATLAASLSMLATNAIETANVTETDLVETLLPQAKERVRTTTVPHAPTDLRLKHGPISGQVLAVCKMAMQNIRLLEVQWAFSPVNGPWTDSEPATSSRGIVVDGLERGKDVWIRVRARNVKGAGPWSDPATIMVI